MATELLNLYRSECDCYFVTAVDEMAIVAIVVSINLVR